MSADHMHKTHEQPIALVSPRYGLDFAGGAERLVRDYAEQLHRRGHPVEVLTTCTTDMYDWNNGYPAGTTEINGVAVHRFRTDDVDIGAVHRVADRAHKQQPITYREQLEFIRNSVNSQALYETLRQRQDEFRCCIFAPYLFGTTYFGARAVPEKALLLPCLHDEPFARFTIYRELMEAARGILFNVEAERRFARESLGVANPNTAVVGYGFDPDTPAGDGARFRAARGLPEEFVLYAGRLEGGKNVPLLLEYFVRYKTERPGPLALVLIGEGEVIQLARPDVIEIGFVSENEKRDAFAGATVFCQPSVNESFSIVLMEAWIQGTPALVHGDCAVTREHVERSGGGWWFHDYAEFRAALDAAVGDAAGRERMGRAGRAYVLREYTWDAVIERLLAAIERFSGPEPLRAVLARRGVRRALAFSRERFDEHLAEVVARAEADLAQGLTHPQIDALRAAARVGMPEYEVRSGAPLVGPAIAAIRRNLTSHLREPYLDPIITRQEAYNQLLLDTLLPALERSIRAQQRLERQVRLLEQQLAELRREQGDQATE